MDYKELFEQNFRVKEGSKILINTVIKRLQLQIKVNEFEDWNKTNSIIPELHTIINEHLQYIQNYEELKKNKSSSAYESSIINEPQNKKINSITHLHAKKELFDSKSVVEQTSNENKNTILNSVTEQSFNEDSKSIFSTIDHNNVITVVKNILRYERRAEIKMNEITTRLETLERILRRTEQTNIKSSTNNTNLNSSFVKVLNKVTDKIDNDEMFEHPDKFIKKMNKKYKTNNISFTLQMINNNTGDVIDEIS